MHGFSMMMSRQSGSPIGGKGNPKTTHGSIVVKYLELRVLCRIKKNKENVSFLRLVPLIVPIGVFVPPHDDGTVSDVTIGM